MTSDITHGTNNVFADLGLPDADDRKTKTQLAISINAILMGRKLKQVAAGEVLGLPQPKVSALKHYRLDGFSVERLMEMLTALDRSVEIRIRRTESPGRIVVLTDP